MYPTAAQVRESLKLTKVDSAPRLQSPSVFLSEEDPSTNLWLDHLNLLEDGISDPPGIRVRPMTGIEAVNYLEKSPLLKVRNKIINKSHNNNVIIMNL